MPRIDFKQIAQPYIGSPEEVQDFLFPARTSAQLGDISDPINTENKFAGRVVFDTTTSLPAWAAGSAPGDAWVSADITVGVDITPS